MPVNYGEKYRTALIDGDVVCYQLAYANKDWSERYCLAGVREFIADVAEASKSHLCSVYLSGPTNFRDRVAVTKPYKGNRSGKEKPEHYSAIRKMLIEDYDTYISDNCEADDDMAFRQTSPTPDTSETVICTVDKDLMMVPGLHYNWRGGRGVVTVSEDEGLRRFFIQWLTGDGVDNIPGLKGVGPAKANKVLENANTVHEMYSAVLEAYNDPTLAHEQARLIWMQRGDAIEYTDMLLKYGVIYRSNNNNNSGDTDTHDNR